MRTGDLEYDLPPELIAQHPAVPRDGSRLLVYNRRAQAVEHCRFPDLLAHLSPGDVMVYNDSRVLKARVRAVRSSGGRVELLFLKRRRDEAWEALLKPSARLKEGEELSLAGDRQPGHGGSGARKGEGAQGGEGIFVLKENLGMGKWLVENRSGSSCEELLERAGEMPLPPYIKAELRKPDRYQTVYAREGGSAAAPTAGLHFTPALIARIRSQGIKLVPLTLHIGLDTFRPIDAAEVGHHPIHREHYRLPAASYEAVLAAGGSARRVVAVGTTVARTLETVFREPGGPLEGDTDLFITPGFEFKAVDALLTNFHLPRSTLLALVMAFAGRDETLKLYREAVRERYRFYSFGDAMLVL